MANPFRETGGQYPDAPGSDSRAQSDANIRARSIRDLIQEQQQVPLLTDRPVDSSPSASSDQSRFAAFGRRRGDQRPALPRLEASPPQRDGNPSHRNNRPRIQDIFNTDVVNPASSPRPEVFRPQRDSRPRIQDIFSTNNAGSSSDAGPSSEAEPSSKRDLTPPNEASSRNPDRAILERIRNGQGIGRRGAGAITREMNNLDNDLYTVVQPQASDDTIRGMGLPNYNEISNDRRVNDEPPTYREKQDKD